MSASARFARLLPALALALGPSLAWSQVSVQEPWARATVAGQTSSGAYMQLRSKQAAVLVEARSPVAAVVELHEMKMVDDVMKMQAIQGLPLPAGQTVSLKPGSYHVMLIDLKQQLKAGEQVPITLVVESADKKREILDIQAEVRSAAGQAGAHKAGNHGH